MLDIEDFKKFIEKNKKQHGSQYTGFTTRCFKCNQDVVSKNIGKDENGIPFFQLKCGCKNKANVALNGRADDL